jgi:hypothetical protein
MKKKTIKLSKESTQKERFYIDISILNVSLDCPVSYGICKSGSVP